jgi:hypothetical protein
VYPAELIELIRDEHGVNGQRNRGLPAVVTAYYGMALSVYPETADEKMYAVVAQGLGWMQGQSTSPEIAKSSISVTRQRIGVPR